MDRRRGSNYGYQNNYGTKTATPSGLKKLQAGTQEVEIFEAGWVKDLEENWRNLKSDPDILNIALHCDI